MPYDLYGTYYASARDAENAEMAQCAAIDADIANKKLAELERKMYNQQQSQDYEIHQKVDFLMSKVEELENRIAQLEASR